jgi:integrase
MSDSSFGSTMKDTRGYLSPGDIRKVIDHAKNLRDRMILWLLWATGCRLRELLMLEVSDISWTDKALYMWTLKRKKKRRNQRPVLVDEATIELIRKYMRT